MSPGLPPTPQATAPGNMPSTWKELVEAWKKRVPLQARKLEDVHCLNYSRDQISIVVDRRSLAAAELLVPESLTLLKRKFQALFGFEGLINVQSKDGTLPQTESTASPTPPPLPETILEGKEKAAAARREQIISTVTDHPLTQSTLSRLQGRIKDVHLHDDQPF